MWTCTKCSYAYNPLWVELCDICESRRTPPSLTQPSLITMTKDDPTATTTTSTTAKEVNLNKFVASRSQHAFEEIAASIVEMPPMASFEQDLEDDEDDDQEADEDDDFNAESSGRDGSSSVTLEWTCKKCTLVNSHRVKACVVCGGSRLRSISAIEDMTLRKGEFWSCSQCTLKNSLSSSACSACKSVRQVPVISGQQTNFRPYTSSPAAGVRPAHHHNRQVLASSNSGSSNTPQNNAIVAGSANTGVSAASNSLAPPVTRMSRSPSPKQERVNVSGAIPKVTHIKSTINVSLLTDLLFTATQHRRRVAQDEQRGGQQQSPQQHSSCQCVEVVAVSCMYFRKSSRQCFVRHVPESSRLG